MAYLHDSRGVGIVKARATYLQSSQESVSAMSRVYVDNLDACIFEQELADEFRTYGVIRRIWVARKSPGYAFIDFDDHRDAQDAISDWDGKHNLRVELSHYYRGGGDRSGCDRDSGELGSGSDRCCIRAHPNDRKSVGEHPYLTATLA